MARIPKKCAASRQQQQECDDCQSGSPSLGALYSHNSRASQKQRITVTELELTKLQVEHVQLFSKHKTLLGQENTKLQQRMTKLLTDDAKLKTAKLRTATGREDFLRDVQSQLHTTQSQFSRIEEGIHTKKTQLEVLNRTKEHKEFRRLYASILRDTVNRQMHCQQMRMSTLEFRNGYVLDKISNEPMQMPAASVRDTLELPVNGKRDLFVQTTCKRKKGSIH